MALWERAQLDPVLRNYLYHIPNGGKRNAREAARFKRMGVRAGVHDYHLPVPRGIYHGLWVELKAGRGKPTAAQIEWARKMSEAGHAVAIETGWENAIKTMLAYLSLRENEGMCMLDNGGMFRLDSWK